MAEQTFRSPGFFEREIDLASKRQTVSGVPGGVIGTATKGPAFVPVTVGDFSDFVNRFGTLHPDRPAVYAAYEFLKKKKALTFMRVLGAGGNDTSVDRDTTRISGAVKGAGFRVEGISDSGVLKVKHNLATTEIASGARVHGGVYFISAKHALNEVGSSQTALVTYPILQDNPSVKKSDSNAAQLLRGVVYTTSGIRLTAMASADSYTVGSFTPAGGTMEVDGDDLVFTAALGLRDSDPVGRTFQTIVNAPAANAGEAVIVTFSGTQDAIVCTITPDDAVLTITTAEVAELVNTGAVDGKTITLSDPDNLRTLQTATGGSAQAMTAGAVGTGDESIATFAAGGGTAIADVMQTSGVAAISSSEFKVVLVDSSNAIHRTMTVSLDPEHDSYIGKVLNTDPYKFVEEKHLLYLDLPVEHELAPATEAFVSAPSQQSISDSPFSGTNAKVWSTMGRMDARYSTAQTPAIISQPFGTQEFDLMHFESLSDGAAGNEEVKVSIANIKAGLDAANPYGTFEVLVRKKTDLDSDPQILEAYPACTLDPNDENFIARVIGDYKTFYNFDADEEEERRLIVRGKYPNRSLYIRVAMSDLFNRGEIPSEALPFGFRGIPVLKTTDSLTDSAAVTIIKDGAPLGQVASLTDLQGTSRPGRVDTQLSQDQTKSTLARLSSPVFPPLPFRFKVTRGKMKTAVGMSGDPALTEKVDPKLFWGLKPERLPRTSSIDNAVLNPNAGGIYNKLIDGYTKFQGLTKSGALLTGSAVDISNANKFTLARVALNEAGTATNIAQYVTASAREHMLEACYFRDADVNGSVYTVEDPGYGTRITMATLLASSSVKFNRFTSYNKFTVPLFGGFDGLNILDKDASLMNDRSSSTDAPLNNEGHASNEFNNSFTANTGLNAGKPGVGSKNSTVMSYRSAIRIMTDGMTVRHNILAIPGIRDAFVADFAGDRTKDYSLALYLMDLPFYSQDMTRLFGNEKRELIPSSSNATPDVRETAEQFSSRVVDNNYTAAYFPDVVLADEVNQTQVKLPSSVVAMKALAFNDSVAFPWFAPAGFNRGALDNVTNVDIRLTAADRDELYDARVNPIANFPDGGFVIFGQKTLQLTKSALDRVNVRRMLLEVKRLIQRIAERLLFEPNNVETRARFINLVTPLLAMVQAQAGIDSFQVVMDDSNNTPEDVENNRLNGRIVVVPTRAIEFIAIDFIITNSGVSFE